MVSAVSALVLKTLSLGEVISQQPVRGVAGL